MIKREPKTKKCANPECSEDFLQFNSTDKYCSHGCFWSDQGNAKKKRTRTVTKRRNAIRNISPKRQRYLDRYFPIRDKYLSEHPVCEVVGCGRPTATKNLHHKAGREFNKFADQWARDNDVPLLIDERYFMACCSECHPRRIHENPQWARDNGYLI